VQEVKDTFAAFRAEFPGADVVSSSFDAFFDALEQVSDSLPVVTSENGDSWINGVAGDPQKVALYRTAAAAFAACSRAGACDLSDARIAAFARWLLKTPEHTSKCIPKGQQDGTKRIRTGPLKRWSTGKKIKSVSSSQTCVVAPLATHTCPKKIRPGIKS
jgi:hypothetical protein